METIENVEESICQCCGTNFFTADMYSFFCEKCRVNACACGADGFMDWICAFNGGDYPVFFVSIKCECGEIVKGNTGEDRDIEPTAQDVREQWESMRKNGRDK